MRACAWGALICFVGFGASVGRADDTHEFDARGVFYHTFDGSFDGSEWFQSFDLDSPNAVHMGDINAGGAWAGTVDAGGNILLGETGNLATGIFSDPDHFSLEITVSGLRFDSVMNRVPGTTPDFPVQLDQLVRPNWKLAGQWVGTRERIDPRTGGVLESHDVSVITSAGLFDLHLHVEGFADFAGVCNTHEQVGFRVVVPTPNDVRYRSFPGSTISVARNMLGELLVHDINTLSWTLMLQTRQSVGNQSQELWLFELERMNPFLTGDMNLNGELDAQDRGIIESIRGNHRTSGDFDIAGDLIRDGMIDDEDLAAWDRLFVGCPLRSVDLDRNGERNFFDVSRFLISYLENSLIADFSGDGVIDFMDVSEFLGAFRGGCS